MEAHFHEDSNTWHWLALCSCGASVDVFAPEQAMVEKVARDFLNAASPQTFSLHRTNCAARKAACARGRGPTAPRFTSEQLVALDVKCKNLWSRLQGESGYAPYTPEQLAYDLTEAVRVMNSLREELQEHRAKDALQSLLVPHDR
jgi:hypothetical protein